MLVNITGSAVLRHAPRQKVLKLFLVKFPPHHITLHVTIDMAIIKRQNYRLMGTSVHPFP